MIEALGFGFVAACILLSALFVVRSPDLVRGVLWLGVTLGATAVLFVMLGAPFLAGIQVLLYVGGVMTLMIFGVMLTRRHTGIAVPAESRGGRRGALVAAALFGVLVTAVARTDALPGTELRAVSGADLGRSILVEHVLAFEVISLLLLGAMTGAIVLARRRDHGEPPPARVSAAAARPPAGAAGEEAAP